MTSSALNIAAYVFGVIGLLWSAVTLYKVLVFAYVYAPVLHDRAIEKYKWPQRPYALVTAGSDGIGKALAIELYRRGFNIILSARNAEKLAKVREEILAARTGEQGDVKIWVEDAAKGRWDPKRLLDVVQGLDVTVVALVNGGSSVFSHPYVPLLTAFCLLNALQNRRTDRRRRARRHVAQLLLFCLHHPYIAALAARRVQARARNALWARLARDRRLPAVPGRLRVLQVRARGSPARRRRRRAIRRARAEPQHQVHSGPSSTRRTPFDFD